MELFGFIRISEWEVGGGVRGVALKLTLAIIIVEKEPFLAS